MTKTAKIVRGVCGVTAVAGCWFSFIVILLWQVVARSDLAISIAEENRLKSILAFLIFGGAIAAAALLPKFPVQTAITLMLIGCVLPVGFGSAWVILLLPAINFIGTGIYWLSIYRNQPAFRESNPPAQDNIENRWPPISR